MYLVHGLKVRAKSMILVYSVMMWTKRTFPCHRWQRSNPPSSGLGWWLTWGPPPSSSPKPPSLPTSSSSGSTPSRSGTPSNPSTWRMNPYRTGTTSGLRSRPCRSAGMGEHVKFTEQGSKWFTSISLPLKLYSYTVRHLCEDPMILRKIYVAFSAYCVKRFNNLTQVYGMKTSSWH